MYAKHPLCGIGTTLLKTCHLDIFKHISHQNVNKHGKHSIWENKTTLSKAWLRVFFELLLTKTLKRVQNTLHGEIEQHYQKQEF